MRRGGTKKRLVGVAVFLVVVSIGSMAGARDAGLDGQRRITLGEVVALALEKNPGIIAAKERWESSLNKPTLVSSLPDPVLKGTYFLKEIETRNGPMEKGFSLSQKFPWIGKLSTRKKVAESEADIVKADYESTRLRVIYQVKEAFFDLYWVHRAIAITRANMNILGQLEGLIRTKYITGEAAQQDLLKVQIELLRLQNDLNTFRDMESVVKVKLNSLLGRPPDAPLGKPEGIRFKRFKVSLDELYGYGRRGSPEMKIKRRMIERWKLKKHLAKLDYFPDVTMGVQYREVSRGDSPMAPHNGQDVWSVMLKINLPIWLQKRRAGVVLAEKEVLAGLSSYRDREERLVSAIKEAYFRAKTAQRDVILYRESLIPRAEQSLQIAKEDYRAGKSGFLDLIDSQRVLLRFQLSYEKALVEFRKSIARLERIVGRDLY